MAGEASRDDLYRVLSAAVDAAFYRAAYADLAQAPIDPVAHYAHTGWREGRDPALWFSTRDYLSGNPDVDGAGINPLYHYLTVGRAEGREVARSPAADRYLFLGPAKVGWTFETGARPGSAAMPGVVAEAAAPLTPAQLALVEANLDRGFYLGANPDVATAGMDPVEHFLRTGWRERRDPRPDFSVADYLELHPDVADSRMNPFVHYLVAGRDEGRQAKRNLGFRYEVIAGLRPMEERLAEAARHAAQVKVDAPQKLAKALAATRSGLADLHVTFSHDDYSTNVGGVQISLQREAARIAQMGRDHLHIFPSRPWPMVLQASPPSIGVLWNGRLAGFFPPAAVAAALRDALSDARPGARSFAIHSLLGHAVDDVLHLLAVVGLKAGYFWIHDFASLCDGYHLMRNDVADCGAPPPESPACTICVYGPWRQAQIRAHERLFEALDLTAVAPSEPALDTWKRGWSFRVRGETVLPHARLVARPGTAPAAGDGPFRLAFIGIPAAYKGWPIFRDLALRFAGDPRYEFLHLARDTVPGLPIEHHPVVVSQDRPFAMREAIEALGVDAALIWSLCRETFSFGAYEAVAAGAAVLTSPDSGNVAAFVRSGGHGRVLDEEAALARLFETGQIRELARARRKPALYDLAFGALTADLLTEAAA